MANFPSGSRCVRPPGRRSSSGRCGAVAGATSQSRGDSTSRPCSAAAARICGPDLAGSRDARCAMAWAVVPGTVQVPPDGQPIVLMADAQTIGGYPQVAHVIAVDLPLVAQLRPGDAVRFREVTLAEAHQLTLARERSLAMLREGLA